MFAPIWRFSVLAALLALPTSGRAAQDEDDDKPEVLVAPARAVRDHLNVFSPEARSKANDDIAEVRARYKTDLVVETLKAPDLAGVDAKDAKAVSQAYEKWVSKHAQALLGKEGILIAIFPGEQRIFCMVGPQTQKAKLFSIENARDLAVKVKPKLMEKNLDATLESAVAYVRATLPKTMDPSVKTDSDTWFDRVFGGGTDKVAGEKVPEPEPISHVTDHANIFSVPARVEANAAIKTLRERYKFDVLVESHGLTPKELNKEFAAELKKSKDKALQAWLKKHAKTASDSKGFAVIFLPRLDPPYTFVWVGADTFKAESLKEHKRVVEDVRRDVALAANAKMHAKDYDGALQIALKTIESELVEHPVATTPRTEKAVVPPTGTKRSAAPAPVPAARENAQKTPWLTYLLIGGGVLLVLWLVMAIFRGLSNANRGAAGAPGAPGYGGGGYGGGAGGGGGFMRGFLGGLVGAAAGMYLYNSMFGGNTSSAWGGDHHSGAAGDVGGTAGSGMGETGDVSDGNRGDWGGSSDTGADAGGGDWGGGGGDDWGGGGGDWGGGGE